jgi:hypothetical protein
MLLHGLCPFNYTGRHWHWVRVARTNLPRTTPSTRGRPRHAVSHRQGGQGVATNRAPAMSARATAPFSVRPRYSGKWGRGRSFPSRANGSRISWLCCQTPAPPTSVREPRLIREHSLVAKSSSSLEPTPTRCRAFWKNRGYRHRGRQARRSPL